MAIELELKLALPADMHDDFRALDLLAGSIENRQALTNTYFDTPDLQLRQARIALRIRRQGDRIIQTLKTSGSSHGGLHDRQEWEWDLPEAALNLDLVQKQLPHLEVDWSQVSTLFDTNFERDSWMIETVNSSIELVLDNGHVKHEDQTDAISEIELELKEGDASELFVVAEIMADSLPLRISQISKAARGYRLLKGATMPTQTVSDNGLDALTRLQDLLEWFEFSHDEAAVTPMIEALGEVRELMPEPFRLELQPLFDNTITELKESPDVQTAKTQLWDRALCQALLRISAYLYLNRQ